MKRREALPGESLEDLEPGELRASLDDQGVLLLRGFGCDVSGLEAFTGRLCESFHHVGTRVQLRQAGDGYSSEVYRDNFTLLGHCEGIYRPWPPPPELCFFMCLTAPATAGGETVLADGVALARQLPGDLLQRFRQEGVIYEARWERARWQAEFGVEGVSALQRLLARFDTVVYRLEGETLHIRYTAPALLETASGREAFANGVLAHLPRITHPRYLALNTYANPSNHVYFGDGEEIEDADINRLIDVYDRVALPHAWRNGDLLLIDNRRVMHGRRMTEGPCERVLVSRFGHWRPTIASSLSSVQ